MTPEAAGRIAERRRSGRLEVYSSEQSFANDVKRARDNWSFVENQDFYLIYDGNKKCVLDSFNKNKETIIYFHGGAHVFPIFENQKRFAVDFARENSFQIVIPKMPLAPEHSYLDYVSYSDELFDILTKNHSIGENYSFIGDSSGAGRALFSLVRNHQVGYPPPKSITLASPWIDLSLSAPSVKVKEESDPWLRLVGLETAARMFTRDYSISIPTIREISDYTSNITRFLIITCRNDLLHSDAILLFEELKDRSAICEFIEEEEIFHAWVIDDIPEAKITRERISNFIKGIC